MHQHSVRGLFDLLRPVVFTQTLIGGGERSFSSSSGINSEAQVSFSEDPNVLLPPAKAPVLILGGVVADEPPAGPKRKSKMETFLISLAFSALYQPQSKDFTFLGGVSKL